MRLWAYPAEKCGLLLLPSCSFGDPTAYLLSDAATLILALATPALATDWSGFYVGGQLGYSDRDLGSYSGDGWRGSGGGQAGYNYQFNGSWVVGGEVDYKRNEIKMSGSPTMQGSIALKARLGYAWDQKLVYGTASVVRSTF